MPGGGGATTCGGLIPIGPMLFMFMAPLPCMGMFGRTASGPGTFGGRGPPKPALALTPSASFGAGTNPQAPGTTAFPTGNGIAPSRGIIGGIPLPPGGGGILTGTETGSIPPGIPPGAVPQAPGWIWPAAALLLALVTWQAPGAGTGGCLLSPLRPSRPLPMLMLISTPHLPPFWQPFAPWFLLPFLPPSPQLSQESQVSQESHWSPPPPFQPPPPFPICAGFFELLCHPSKTNSRM